MQRTAPHTETTNILEKAGLRVMRALAPSKEPVLKHWPRKVLSRIRHIERNSLILAAMLGATSGTMLGGTELGLIASFGEDRGGESLAAQWRYWAIYAAVALAVSGAEIAVLYWRILLAVGRIGALAGLDLDRDDADRIIALGLSRAAMDMPNPREKMLGVDPYSRLPRWKLLMYTIIYRAKIGATSVVLRVLLRRILARAALRSFIPFAAIGVYAVWNAIIVRWILKQARIRAAGPVAMRDLDRLNEEDRPALTPESRQLVFRAVGESIVRGQDAHPNYVLLLGQLLDRFDLDPEENKGEYSEQALQECALDDAARRVLLRTLTTATVLRGPPRKEQRKFLSTVAGNCGRRLDPEALDRVQHDVHNGQGVDASRLDAVTPAASG